MLISTSSFFIVLIFAATLGRMTTRVWFITPTKWLCDYGESPRREHEPEARNLNSFTRVFQIIFFLYLLQSMVFDIDFTTLLFQVLLLFLLLQLSISDIKFQILQDQWIFLIAVLSIAIPGKFETKIQGLLWPLFIYYVLDLLQKLWNIKAPFGMGDAKLMAALGFCFGPASLFFISCYAFLLSGGWAALLVVQKKVTRKDRIYFGPFLSIGCVYFMVSTTFI